MKRFVLFFFLANIFFECFAVDYYSQGSANPGNTGNWGTLPVGGAPPPNFTTAGSRFIIQNGHTMTTTGTWTIGSATSALQIQSGGTLRGNHSIRLTGTFQIDNGGRYIHSNSNTTSVAAGQSIFSGTELFASNSNFEIRNWTLGLSPLPVISSPWGNLIINMQVDPGASWEWQVAPGTPLTINGNLDIQSTYSGIIPRELRLTGNGDETINIGGDLVLSGTTTQVNMKNDNAPASGYTTMQVTGNVTLSNSAQLNLGVNFANPVSDVELYQLRFKGNFAAAATNSITANSGIVQLVANGIVPQSLSCLATMDCNFLIASGSTVDLSSSLTYGIGNRVLAVLGTLNQNGYSMTVNGTLEAAGGTFNGSGAFTITSNCRACSNNGTYNTANSTWCAVSGTKGTVNFSSSTITLVNGATQSFLTAGIFSVFSSPGDIYFINSTATSNSMMNLANYIVEPNCIFSLDGSSYIAGANARYIGRGGTLRIGSADGITAWPDVTTGNVRTGFSKTYEFSGTNNFEYFGTNPQVTGDGLPTTIAGTLRIDNSSPLSSLGVTLTNPTTINGFLDLDNGKLRTSAASLITISAVGNFTSYSSNSFIGGPLQVIGHLGFTYPIGINAATAPTGTIYAPIVMNNVSGTNNPTDSYTAEYIRGNPQSAISSIVESPINHISFVEYWKFLRTDGGTNTPVKQIVLEVNQESICYNLNTLLVARYDGSQWRNEGNISTILLGSSWPLEWGKLFSNNTITNVSGYYTLSTTDAFIDNPLPINLISFDGTKLTNTKSSLNWELATYCSAAAKFEIQRAGTDKNFSKIAVVNGSETNKSYNYIDNDLKNGINYYRLKMIDEYGKITYSRTVAVMNGVNGLLLTSLIPTMVTNSAMLTIASSRQQKMDLIITDMQGRIMQKQNHAIGAGNTNIQLSTGRLSTGVYQLTGVTAEGKTNVIRFIRQ